MYIKLLSCSLKVFSFLLNYVSLENLYLKHREASKSSFFLNFTNEIYHYRNFFYENIKQYFYETNFL